MAETSPIEDQQRRALVRNRRLATGLLVFVVLVFLGTLVVPEPGFWTRLLRATAEAGVAGALADWFAVTAVFRRPLGLPIPHTAIVPRSKDRIGAGLGRFVETPFLTPDLLSQRLGEAKVAKHMAEWLSQPTNAEALADRVVAGLPYVVRSLGDKEIRAFVGRALGEQLKELELAPILARLLSLLSATGHGEALLDNALLAARNLIDSRRDDLDRLVAERTAWWIPKTVDRRIAKSVVEGVRNFIEELRLPGSESRQKLLEMVAHFSAETIHSKAWRTRIEGAKHNFLQQEAVQEWLVTVGDRLREFVLADLESPKSRTREALAKGAQSLGYALAADEAMRQRFDRAVERIALHLLSPWRGEIGRIIEETVKSWDAGTVTARIELAVGGDLQIIRINGTLVGSLVGCALYLISTFFI